MHNRTTNKIIGFLIVIGMFGGMYVSADSIVITQQPHVVVDKCQFEVSFRFDDAVQEFLSTEYATIDGFTRSGDDPMEVGNATYNFTYSIDLGDEKTFAAKMLPKIACFDQPCTRYNQGYTFPSQTITCSTGSTTPITPPPATDTTITPPVGDDNITSQCTPPNCNPDKREKCVQMPDGTYQCICVPGPGHCCGVNLNTNVPFIGNCIQLLSAEEKQALRAEGLLNDPNTTTVTDQEAFPILMMGLTKILVTVILLASFIAIIVAGVMIAASGSSDSASKGMKLIGSVVAALALLGASGVILRLINPNFFG